MNPRLARFMALFEGSDRSCGQWDVRRNSAVTLRRAAGPADFKAHINGQVGLGVCPIMDDDTVRFGVLDIDNHHGEIVDHAAIVREVERQKLPLIVCQSKSGGAHCYLFLREKVKAKLVVQRLQQWASMLNVATCEKFPKQTHLAGPKAIGSWINLPYFNAAVTERYALSPEGRLSVRDFLDYAEARSLSAADFKAGEEADQFGDGPPCINTLIRAGIQEGMRNQALFALGVYSKRKFPTEWPILLREWNATIFNPPLDDYEVAVIVKSLAGHEYFYACKQEPLCSMCDKPTCAQRKYGIGQAGFSGVTFGELQKIQTSPPTWKLRVEDVWVTLQTEQLMNYRMLRRVCLEAVDKVLPPMKDEDWLVALNDRLKNLERIIAPADASQHGLLERRLHHFLQQHERSNGKLESLLLGMPVVQGKKICFQSIDFIAYLKARRAFEMKPQELWASLREIGCEHDKLKIKGKTIEVWVFTGDLNRQSEEFDEVQFEEDV